MDFLYPDIEDAKAAWPIVRQAIQGNTSDRAAIVKAAYVLQGFAFSMYPGEPGGGFGALAEAPAEGYSREQMVSDLDDALARGDQEGRALPKLPWSVIIPILMQLLQEWLKK